MSRTSCLTLFALSFPCTALAADAGVFHLGTVLVTAKRPEVGEILSEQVSSVVTADEIRRFDRPTVSVIGNPIIPSCGNRILPTHRCQGGTDGSGRTY